MSWKDEWKVLLLLLGAFVGIWFLPLESPRVEGALMEALYLLQWYAREHVLLCLVPALFIAGEGSRIPGSSQTIIL